MLSILMDTRAALERERRRLMTRRSSLRPGTPVSPEIAAVIASFVPKWPAQDLKLWSGDLGDAVRGWVTYACPAAAPTARQLLRYAGGLTLWVYKTQRSIKPADVWPPHVVEYWVDTINAGQEDGWRATAFSRLASLGPLVAPKVGWRTARREISRRGISQPYSESDEQAYLQAAWMADKAMRPRLLFAVAAGFGAGLDGRWLHTIAPEHVIVERDAVRIIVTDGADTREVPLRETYRDAMLEALATCTSPFLIGPNASRHNLVCETLRRLAIDGLDAPNGRRMRNTWITHLLEAGVDVAYLMRIAGVSSLGVIIEMARHIQVIDEAESLRRALLA
jgi:hypothetical protein